VIIAVVAVRVMQMAANAVVDVVAVRDRFVATARAVHMTRRMATATVIRLAAVGILARDLDHVLVDVTLMRMVKMSIVQIVDVPGMAHGGVAAARAMLVGVVAVLC
jgi:hypothetical protein